MILSKQIASAIAAGAVLVNTALPVFAETTIVISGNGAGSDNFSTVSQTNTTTVTQSNDAHVDNNVTVNANTGDNSASFNTGGDVAVGTGNAVSNVSVTNTLNSNKAEVACCDTGSTDVKIEGNGAFSDNTVTLGKTTATALTQDNDAHVDNNIDSSLKTGDNRATSNTGGDVTVVTGNAKSDVAVSTTANVNEAVIGSVTPSNSPSVSLKILGNGAGSDNFITAMLGKSVTLDQDNDAHVDNKVETKADTGDNAATFTTAGDVIIHTGKAVADVAVDNAVNFNYAAGDCGCTWDLTAKIEGNGAGFLGNGKEGLLPLLGEDNVISVGLANSRVIGQENDAHLDNSVGGHHGLDLETGDNKVEMSVGGVSGADPYVVTGNAKSSVDVDNSGNSNIYGGSPVFHMPGADVEFSLDLSVLMQWLGLHLS